MKNPSPSPHGHSQKKQSPSPAGFHPVKAVSPSSPSNNNNNNNNNHRNEEYLFCVEPRLRGILAIFVFLDVIFVPFALKIYWFFVPLILCVLTTIYLYLKIDDQSAKQAHRVSKLMTKEQISMIIKNKENPCVDSHVRAKLKNLQKSK